MMAEEVAQYRKHGETNIDFVEIKSNWIIDTLAFDFLSFSIFLQ